ncbi:MAG TPA: cupredoxin domain-containing protein [Candidatus Udaeobacter sp.]|jgi:hypothetical protein|nr:cupredoxin domain-containing protein [Candidatus Udaeobacter sp.]
MKNFARLPLTAFVLTLFGVVLLCWSDGLRGQERAAIAITVKNKRFEPAEIRAPANRPLALEVKNLDAGPIEFESFSLRVEKVIAPGSIGMMNVRALVPGRYEFFDDFHPETRGVLIVQ